MKHLSKILGTVALALIAGVLMATTTWSSSTTYSGSVKAACTVGNEGIVGPTAATDGLALANSINHINVTLEAPQGSTLRAGVFLRAWIFNAEAKAPDGGVGGWWAPAPSLDLGPTKGGSMHETWAGLRATSHTGRIAFLPDSCGGACNVYIGSERSTLERSNGRPPQPIWSFDSNACVSATVTAATGGEDGGRLKSADGGVAESGRLYRCFNPSASVGDICLRQNSTTPFSCATAGVLAVQVAPGSAEFLALTDPVMVTSTSGAASLICCPDSWQ